MTEQFGVCVPISTKSFEFYQFSHIFRVISRYVLRDPILIGTVSRQVFNYDSGSKWNASDCWTVLISDVNGSDLQLNVFYDITDEIGAIITPRKVRRSVIWRLLFCRVVNGFPSRLSWVQLRDLFVLFALRFFFFVVLKNIIQSVFWENECLFRPTLKSVMGRPIRKSSSIDITHGSLFSR